MTTSFTRLAAAAGLVIFTGAALAGCSMMGGGGSGGSAGSLPGALTARMDQPGAVLDRREAINLINSYRATRGVAPLSNDAGLEGTAQALANQYAQTGNAPATPQGVVVMKLSAGYSTIANTFSGWRNSPADAAALAAPASKAGIAVAFNASSSYGVYWVLVLGN